MKKIILIALGLLFIAGIGLLIREKRTNLDPEPPESDYPLLQNYRFISIQEFNRRNPGSGFYNLEEYVTEISYCPPCPPGAVCIQCMEDYIVISESNQRNAFDVLTDADLVIFAQNPIRHFLVGEKYRFSVQVKKMGRKPTEMELKQFMLQMVNQELKKRGANAWSMTQFETLLKGINLFW